jgi:hypothetical protein
MCDFSFTGFSCSNIDSEYEVEEGSKLIWERECEAGCSAVGQAMWLRRAGGIKGIHLRPSPSILKTVQWKIIRTLQNLEYKVW